MAARPNVELPNAALERQLLATRALSEALVAPLSEADAAVQSMADASPAKWHLAHTTWFFETFVLRDHVPAYRAYDARWAYLFNSYYEGEGDRHPRALRGMLTRPSLAEILGWRRSVDDALLAALPGLTKDARVRVTLGIHHEQQHQELLLTDILSLFAQNPLAPAMWDQPRNAPAAPGPIRWIAGRAGVIDIGHDGAGFAFDCEGPRHAIILRPHMIADRCVTNQEWRAFMDDGGYHDPAHWLSDGWAWRSAQAIEAPLYWRRDGEGGWVQFALDGLKPIHPAAPISHISHYEADAFARWAGARLPTEGEWESAATDIDPYDGNQLDHAGPVRPRAARRAGDGCQQMFGDVWEWTASAFLPYPGFTPAAGAIGEYNGKFMSGQHVLKGASCATPRGHSRASYRNFFQPDRRWQFTGLRLAKDA